MEKDNNGKKIPSCQQIQNEYKKGLINLRETIAEIKQGNSIPMETFVNCMSFIYREGWGDCFCWQGDIAGEETRKEFFEILQIERYGRS
jgi:hypothetical protein